MATQTEQASAGYSQKGNQYAGKGEQQKQLAGVSAGGHAESMAAIDEVLAQNKQYMDDYHAMTLDQQQRAWDAQDSANAANQAASSAATDAKAQIAQQSAQLGVVRKGIAAMGAGSQAQNADVVDKAYAATKNFIETSGMDENSYILSNNLLQGSYDTFAVGEDGNFMTTTYLSPNLLQQETGDTWKGIFNWQEGTRFEESVVPETTPAGTIAALGTIGAGMFFGQKAAKNSANKMSSSASEKAILDAWDIVEEDSKQKQIGTTKQEPLLLGYTPQHDNNERQVGENDVILRIGEAIGTGAAAILPGYNQVINEKIFDSLEKVDDNRDNGKGKDNVLNAPKTKKNTLSKSKGKPEAKIGTPSVANTTKKLGQENKNIADTFVDDPKKAAPYQEMADVANDVNKIEIAKNKEEIATLKDEKPKTKSKTKTKSKPKTKSKTKTGTAVTAVTKVVEEVVDKKPGSEKESLTTKEQIKLLEDENSEIIAEQKKNGNKVGRKKIKENNDKIKQIEKDAAKPDKIDFNDPDFSVKYNKKAKQETMNGMISRQNKERDALKKEIEDGNVKNPVSAEEKLNAKHAIESEIRNKKVNADKKKSDEEIIAQEEIKQREKNKKRLQEIDENEKNFQEELKKRNKTEASMAAKEQKALRKAAIKAAQERYNGGK